MECFATLLKILHLKKIARKYSIFLHGQKMFHISSPFAIFPYGKVKCILGRIKIKFHLGRTQGRGKRRYGGEAQNEVCFFLQNSLIKQDARYKLHLTNCCLDKLLITTTMISMPKNLNARTLKWFWVVLPGQKQLCVFLRNKYGFHIGNAIFAWNNHGDKKEEFSE